MISDPLVRPSDVRSAHSSLPPTRRIPPAVAFTAISIVVWLFSLKKFDITKVDGSGLLSATPRVFFVAVALLAVGFVAALVRPQVPSWFVNAQLALGVLFLHGTGILVQPLARFPTGWVHAGFTEYIMRTGSTMPNVDARYSWPGFFAAGGVLTRSLGLSDPVSLLRFAPLFFVSASALGVYSLARAVTRNQLVAPIATWLFLTVDWIGQDYFAPQALGYLLGLAFLNIVVRYFRASGGLSQSRWHRLQRWLPDEPGDLVDRRSEVALHVVALGLFTAIVVSHQLTPVFLLSTVTMLVIAGRLRERSLPLVMFAIFISWVSFGAKGFWSGHLDDMFGGFGRLSSMFGQNVGSRMQGAPVRVGVQQRRLLLIGVLYATAAIGLLRRWRRGFGDATLILLAVSPFAVLMAQSYGGEALMRCVYFSLPAMCILAAMAFTPADGATFRWPAGALLGVALSLLAPLFIAARYGNDAWDTQTLVEHQAYEFIYDRNVAGTVITFVSDTPVGYTRRDSMVVLPRNEPQIAKDLEPMRELAEQHPGEVYIVLTRSQIEFGRLFGGLPDDWAASMVRQLRATGRYQVIFENSDSIVLLRPAGGAS